jgi:hypothetical protein
VGDEVIVWSEDHPVNDVNDPEALAEILTYPYPQFVIDYAEPLLEVVDAETATILAYAGIVNLEMLALLDEDGFDALMQLGYKQEEIEGWRDKAYAIAEAPF